MHCIAIIITYKIGKDIYKYFNSVVSQVDAVLIIDNGSSDETLICLKEIEKNEKVKVIFNNENMGIAAALNQGVEYAIGEKYDWVLCLDHDSECNPDMVRTLFEHYRNISFKNKVAILAPNIIDKNTGELYCKEHGIKELDMMQTSGSLIKTEVFKYVGFFNDSLFLYYVDDDFCLRLRKKGYRIIGCCSALLYHRTGMTQKKFFMGKQFYVNNYNYIARYYLTRNAIYIVKNYFPLFRRYTYSIVRRFFEDFLKIVLFEKDKFKKIRYIFNGLIDGIANNYGKLSKIND